MQLKINTVSLFKISVLLAYLFFASSALFGQSTTLSGTVTDTPDGQTWNGGKITGTFVTNVNYPVFSNYSWTGGTLPFTVSGVLSGTGTYSISVPSNSAITPINSFWSFQVCAQGIGGCFTLGNLTVTGATQTQNFSPPSIRINLSTSVPPISAYTNGELIGAVLGSQYFNLTSFTNQVCTAVSGNLCTTWASAGGGLPTGLTFSSPTLTVSSATNGNGVLALSGNTSGTATFTAPAVAGTATNPVAMSNVLQGPNGSAASPTYQFTSSANTGMFLNGGSLAFSAAGQNNMLMSSTLLTIGVPITATAYQTFTKCASSVSPAVCGSAAAGSVAVPTGATPTLQINTTAITATSQVFLNVTEAPTVGTTLGVTCNTTLSTLVNPVETLRVAGASFTIQMNSTLAVNPACVHYLIVN
jgi:hypothetical protein